MLQKMEDYKNPHKIWFNFDLYLLLNNWADKDQFYV